MGGGVHKCIHIGEFGGGVRREDFQGFVGKNIFMRSGEHFFVNRFKYHCHEKGRYATYRICKRNVKHFRVHAICL